MSSFVRVAIVSAVLTTAAIGLLWVGGFISILSDDDRPPVVVSGGSVIIEQQVDAMDDKRGNFEQVTQGDRKVWRAGHGNGKKPKYLTVIIDNSTSAVTGCRPTDVHKNLTSVTFTYTPDVGVDTTFTAAIVNDELRFTFPVDAEQTAGTEFRLTIPAATLTRVNVGGTDCDLGAGGRVELRQRKQ